MEKCKNIIFAVAKSLAIVIGSMAIALAVFALGRPESVTTQIGTIFGPMVLPYAIAVLAVIVVMEIIFVWKKGKGNAFKNKLSVAARAFSVIALVMSLFIWESMCFAIRSNGGSITIFDTLFAASDPTDDGKAVYANHDGEDLTISIYQNEKRTEDALSPVYVYIHGGGWQSADSEANGVMHRNMAKAGYLGFSINYRLCTDEKATWDTAIYDCAEAMNWIYEHAKEYGGDPDRIVLSGESAGGHLALLYAGRASNGSLDAPVPNAVCVMYPVVDLEWTSKNARYLTSELVPGIVERYIGGSLEEYPERVEEIAPLTHINANMPPVLIIHGKKDTLVTITGSEAYAEKLTELGVENKLVEIPYCNHGTIGNESMIVDFLKNIEGMQIA